MPLRARWRNATLEDVKERVPERAGVYELRCFGELVYIGSSKNLRRRLTRHVRDRCPNRYRYRTVWFWQNHVNRERAHYDAYVDAHGAPPAWNHRRP